MIKTVSKGAKTLSTVQWQAPTFLKAQTALRDQFALPLKQFGNANGGGWE